MPELVPIFNRPGDIVAYAIVDVDDAEEVWGYRWHLNDKGYAKRTDDGRVVYMHRQLLGLERGDPREGDHINRNRLDNRRANLRIGSRELTGQNRGANSNGSSRYRGVSWDKQHGKWHAYARVDNKLRFVGRFDNEDEAGHAAAAFRAEHMAGAVEVSA